MHADQRLFQGVEARRVQHFPLDPGGVRTPRHKEKLLLLAGLGGALALVVVLEVEQAVAALALASLGQVVEELREDTDNGIDRRQEDTANSLGVSPGRSRPLCRRRTPP